MKKVAIIMPEYLPEPAILGGGVETLVNDLLQLNETEKKFQFTVYSIYNQAAKQSSKDYLYSKFKYFEYKKKKNFIKRAIRKFAKQTLLFNRNFYKKILLDIQKNQFDFILVENKTGLVPLLKKYTNAPILVHIHNIDQIRPNTWVNIAKDCYKILVVSDYVKRCVKEIFSDVKDNKIEIVHNFVNLDLFNENKYLGFRENFRKMNQIATSDRVLIFSGRVIASKGVLNIINALKDIEDRNIHLLIVGASWYNSQSYSEFEKKLIFESSKLSNKVIFTGFVSHSETAKYYAASDIGVFPSIQPETAGLVQLESMASSKATIVSSAGGMPEYIGSEGIVVPLDEHFQSVLEKSIEMTCKLNNNELKNKGILLRKHVRRFSVEKSFEELVESLK